MIAACARVVGFGRQLPAGLPQQPVDLDQRQIAAMRETARQRGLASRRIADDNDPGHREPSRTRLAF
jgi:hypothetical protein